LLSRPIVLCWKEAHLSGRPGVGLPEIGEAW